jgi:hypothetical protein
MSDIASAYAERGYDVGQRDAGVVLDVPNPDITSDDYFHGENPHKVGFGSRGPAAERADLDLTVDPGQSTAEALDREDGAGWTAGEQDVQSGAPATTGSASGAPDESWRNDDIRDYAEQNDIHIASNANKQEMLDAIREAGH